MPTADIDHRLRQLSPERRASLVEALLARGSQGSTEGPPSSASPSATLESEAASVLPKSEPRQTATADAPLSYAQMRLWLLDQLGASGDAYVIPVLFTIDGPLVAGALASALAAVVRRHDVLRTHFPLVDGQPVQRVTPSAASVLTVVDLSGIPDARREREATRVAQDASRPAFVLARGPLFKATLVRLDANRHLLALALHHTIADGWSVGILLDEVARGYAFAGAGRSPAPPVALALAPLAMQYADVARAQQESLAGAAGSDEALDWWRTHLTGAPPVIELPTDRPRTAIQDFAGASVTHLLDAGQFLAIDACARRHGVTPFMLLLTVWQLLLARLSGQTDIVVGVPVAGRPRVDLEPLIGCFVNTLPVRTRVDDDPSVAVLLARVRATCVQAFAYQDVPFEKLVEVLQPDRRLSHQPICQVLCVFQNTPTPSIQLPDLRVTPQACESRGAKFDLTLSITPSDAGAELAIEYRTALFDRDTVVRIMRGFTQLCDSLIRHPQQRASELRMLPDDEWNREVRTYGARSESSRDVRCLHHAFETQARERPGAIAVTCDATHLTYADVNARANRLAHALRACGVGPESRVALLLSRTPWQVVAILAVLKTGAAYVPLDPEHPAARHADILADARPAAIVTEAAFVGSLAGTLASALASTATAIPIIDLDRAHDPIARESEGNLSGSSAGHPDSLAYIIYTSGSTGVPKGVMVTHANVCRLLTATTPWYAFGADDVWSLFHSYAFDVSVWEMWGALLYGGRIVVVPYLVSRSPQEFRALLVRERVTIVSQTPSAFQQWANYEDEAASLEPLAVRAVVFAGEALSMPRLASFMTRHGEDRPALINMYGITETTVHTTFRQIRRRDLDGPSVIGRQIPDMDLFVLDDAMQPAPVGVAGEIYVGGGGVARGYLNRPALTARRFVPHPYSRTPGDRLYRSGDRARRLPDGDLEYLGRLDHQIKIRGFRVELGEIESALQRDPAVRQALVISEPDHDGGARLTAYVVPAGDASPDVDALRAAVRTALPDYMVPQAIVVLDRLPLTVNGKLDRAALPKPAPMTRSAPLAVPEGATETALAEIWKTLLGVSDVGRTDDFFQLGGHSLLATRLTALIRERLRVELPIRLVFEHPTLQDLAALTDAHASSGPLIEAAIPKTFDASDAARMLAEVDDLSPEAIDRLMQTLMPDAPQDVTPNVTPVTTPNATSVITQDVAQDDQP